MLNHIKQLFSNGQEIILPKDAPNAEREQYRVIPLNKTHNFRDIGGYRGENGRLTKWGILYRSDNLHHLKPASFATLQQLNLEQIIDFRSSYEKTEEPNQLPPDLLKKVQEIPILDRGNKAMSGRGLREKIKNGDVADLDGVALMKGANRQFVTEYNPEYRQFIHAVLEANGQPVLFHCTGGKDRTGFATALLLTILEVDKETIYADYLRSNDLILKPLARRLKVYSALRGKEATEVVMALARVERAYLDEAFHAIDRVYGSFANYLETGLQLSSVEIGRLKTMLLEG